MERDFVFSAKANISYYSDLGVLSRGEFSNGSRTSLVFQTHSCIYIHSKQFCFKTQKLQTTFRGIFIVQHITNYLIYVSIVTISRNQAEKMCAAFVQQLHCHIPSVVQLYSAAWKDAPVGLFSCCYIILSCYCWEFLAIKYTKKRLFSNPERWQSISVVSCERHADT